ncbi:MAG: hypothetical protein LBL18_02490 [Bacteroidales bacterium]|jgi:hypothetical protein|nr:hypothetical protein [Bacteroidales bacterium]
MKKHKNIISIAIIALTALVVISCEKEEPILPNTTGVSSNIPFKANSIDPSLVGCKEFVTEWCTDCHQYCNNTGDNCAPCVTVVGSALSHQVIENIENLTEQPGRNVAKFFADPKNYQDLLPELGNSKEGETFLKLLLSGDYVIEKVITSTDRNGVILFKYIPASPQVGAAPASSPTFAIPFSITEKNV